MYEQRVQSVRLPALHAPMWPHFSAPTSFLRSNESRQLLEQPGKTLPGWYCPLCFSLPQPAELHSSISAFCPARLWSPDAAASPAPGSAGCQTSDRRHRHAHREYLLMAPSWFISPSAWVHTFRATVLLKSKLRLKMCQLKRCSLNPLSTPYVKHDTGFFFFFGFQQIQHDVCEVKSCRHVLIKYKFIHSLTDAPRLSTDLCVWAEGNWGYSRQGGCTVEPTAAFYLISTPNWRVGPNE